jgi:signal transduction histidine kinase
MLHEFVTANRDEIIARCRAKISSRPVPCPTDAELEYGVPLFLDQLVEVLRTAGHHDEAMAESARKHGTELLHRGFTIAQVVHDYGGVCQAITELAVARSAAITAAEFQTLNLCLDNAIAGAVTEYGRLREHEGTERLGRFAHELRNLLSRAMLSFEMLKTGSVGLHGSTGAVLTRSLAGLVRLIDRELTDVRLTVGAHQQELIAVRDFIEDIEVTALLEATARGLKFSVSPVAADVIVQADRQILVSVIGNLLQNAFKFTKSGGQVSLCVRVDAERVLIDVEDQCGGLPPGQAEELFRPFAQHGADRSGLGLGLAICLRGSQAIGGELRVVNHPGHGCVFTLDLPRQPPPGSPAPVASRG